MFALRLQVCKLPYLCRRAVLHSWQKGDFSRTRRVGGGSSSAYISSWRGSGPLGAPEGKEQPGALGSAV